MGIQHNAKVRVLKVDWARMSRSGLSLAWLFSVGIIAVLVFTRNYWLAAAVIPVVVVGSIRLWRRSSEANNKVTWNHALHISRTTLPRRDSIDPNRPLIAMIVTGRWAGRYALVSPGEHDRDWVFYRGPAGTEATPRDSELAHSEDSVGMEALRFLPQGQLSDEIWRRNFDSLRRGSKFRGLPR